MFKLSQVQDLILFSFANSSVLFDMDQGEYIAPERIENIYIQSKYIAQVFVYGNSYKVKEEKMISLFIV